MDVVLRLRRILGLTRTPVRPQHVYNDTITGERFRVKSVGPGIRIEKLDVDGPNATHTVRSDQLRSAIDDGYVEHADSCPECR